jgi:hypothetical protein
VWKPAECSRAWNERVSSKREEGEQGEREKKEAGNEMVSRQTRGESWFLYYH